jgi:hypothetical protein
MNASLRMIAAPSIFIWWQRLNLYALNAILAPIKRNKKGIVFTTGPDAYL